MKEKTKYYLALNMVPALGALRAARLLQRLGGPGAVFKASQRELQTVEGIGREIAGNIAGWDAKRLDNELRLIEKHNIRIVTFADKDYPAFLKEIYSPPIVLYVKGKLVPEDSKAIAVVGTRQPTYYGRTVAEELSGDLARYGLTIVSGMARGIDSFAHSGALKAKGRTIAVLGCGIDIVYPPENAKLMRDIEASGAVVTEFPFGTAPDRMNFPRRNRIIGGLCLGVVVVEAARRSGSLITADFALEQGREVFAIPGKVGSPVSQGTHSLLKQGARLVENAEDIIEELSGAVLPDQPSPKQKSFSSVAPMNEDEKKIYELLSDEPVHIDTIVRKTGLSPARASSILLPLEIKKVVQQLAGQMYVRRKRL